MFQPPFLRLPMELHCKILDQLELHDRVHVASITHHFRQSTKPPTHAELLDSEAGECARNRQLLACKGYLCLRPFAEFADTMRKNKRCRGGAEAHTRFCIGCGVNKGWYSLGTHITIRNVPHMVCEICGTVTEMSVLGDCLQCPRKARWACLWPLIPGSCGAEGDCWSVTTRRYYDGHHSQDYHDTCPDL